MYEGREIIVTKSSEPGGKCPSLTHSALTEDLIEGGYVMEGEGLPDNLPPGSNPGPAFKDHTDQEYWHVKKVHAKRINPATGEEEFEVEWEGYVERQWLPAESVAGLPEAQALRAQGAMFGPA